MATSERAAYRGEDGLQLVSSIRIRPCVRRLADQKLVRGAARVEMATISECQSRWLRAPQPNELAIRTVPSQPPQLQKAKHIKGMLPAKLPNPTCSCVS